MKTTGPNWPLLGYILLLAVASAFFGHAQIRPSANSKYSQAQLTELSAVPTPPDLSQIPFPFFGVPAPADAIQTNPPSTNLTSLSLMQQWSGLAGGTWTTDTNGDWYLTDATACVFVYRPRAYFTTNAVMYWTNMSGSNWIFIPRAEMEALVTRLAPWGNVMPSPMNLPAPAVGASNSAAPIPPSSVSGAGLRADSTNAP